MNPTCKRFKVEGRVQGVFFRKYTQEKARELGLEGWVRNCSDGRVETVVMGDEEALLAFEKWLWQGSPDSKVLKISSKVCDSPKVDGFSILQSF